MQKQTLVLLPCLQSTCRWEGEQPEHFTAGNGLWLPGHASL